MLGDSSPIESMEARQELTGRRTVLAMPGCAYGLDRRSTDEIEAECHRIPAFRDAPCLALYGWQG